MVQKIEVYESVTKVTSAPYNYVCNLSYSLEMSMKAGFILDRYITPSLAIVTVSILLIGGCESRSDNERVQTEQSYVVDSRPDPNVPQGEDFEYPEGWIVRLDRPDSSAVVGSAKTADIFFVNMTPGWHITTKKAAIFYHPASTANGDYTARAGIYFSDPGDHQREAYGLFFGGSDLDSETQAYGYFLLRNTGEFLIKQRVGQETTIVQDWTQSDAVLTVPAGSQEPVLNELSIQVADAQVHFILNGENVATHPASSIPNQGMVGFRLNHGTDVHVADLSVQEEI
ncbi:MAG: hypothetical protein ACC655_01730 [Rhodothermia bacterium]